MKSIDYKPSVKQLQACQPYFVGKVLKEDAEELQVRLYCRPEELDDDVIANMHFSINELLETDDVLSISVSSVLGFCRVQGVTLAFPHLILKEFEAPPLPGYLSHLEKKHYFFCSRGYSRISRKVFSIFFLSYSY